MRSETQPASRAERVLDPVLGLLVAIVFVPYLLLVLIYWTLDTAKDYVVWRWKNPRYVADPANPRPWFTSRF